MADFINSVEKHKTNYRKINEIGEIGLVIQPRVFFEDAMARLNAIVDSSPFLGSPKVVELLLKGSLLVENICAKGGVSWNNKAKFGHFLDKCLPMNLSPIVPQNGQLSYET